MKLVSSFKPLLKNAFTTTKVYSINIKHATVGDMPLRRYFQINWSFINPSERGEFLLTREFAPSQFLSQLESYFISFSTLEVLLYRWLEK